MKSANVQKNLKYYGQAGGKKGRKPSANKPRTQGKAVKRAKGFKNTKRSRPVFDSGNSIQ